MLFVFEGIDGTGKSTQVLRVADLLDKTQERGVVSLRMPSNTHTGRIIRDLMYSGNYKMHTKYALAQMNLRDHMSRSGYIQGLLNEGVIVLMDRYYYSTMVYQGKTHEAEQGYSATTIRDMMEPVVRPTAVFHLSLPAEVAFERIQNSREEVQDIEKLERLKESQNRYNDVFYRDLKWGEGTWSEKIVSINAEMHPDVVTESIMQHLLRFLEA